MHLKCLYLTESSNVRGKIRAAEQQLQRRQQQVDICSNTLKLKIHQQITTPSTLLLAAGSGFVLGELTKCSTSKLIDTIETSPLRIAIDLITFVRAVYLRIG